MRTTAPFAFLSLVVSGCFSSAASVQAPGTDAATQSDATVEAGSPQDTGASPVDSGLEAAMEAATEAGVDAAREAGVDASVDASVDAPVEAGDGGRGPWQYVVLAGTGSAGFTGDNGPATSAQLGGYLSGMAKDANGNLYIADAGNARIRRVSASGTITTFAGNGTPGQMGDQGPATSAEINGPSGVAVDAAGNVYFSEFNNSDVRIVDHATGNIDTYVALGSQPTGICLDAAGNLYVAMFSQNQIWKYDTSKVKTVVAGTGTGGFSGDNGAATSAKLSNPNGVWADAQGNVYIVDANNNRVRKVSSTGTITTIAGNGTGAYAGDEGPATSAQLSPSYGVTVDAAGNVYIADTGNNRIRQVDTAGVIHTLAGNGTTTFTSASGPALNVGLNAPGYSWMDAQGAMYFSDNNTSVYKIY